MSSHTKPPSFFAAFCSLLPEAMERLGCQVSVPQSVTSLTHEKAALWASTIASTLVAKEPLLLSPNLQWHISPDRYSQLQFYGQDTTNARGIHSFSVRLFQKSSSLAHDVWDLNQASLPLVEPNLKPFFEQALPLVQREWSSEVEQQRFHWHDVTPALIWRWKSALLAPWQRTLEQDSLSLNALFDRCFGKHDSYWIFSSGKEALAIEPIQRTGRLGFDGNALPPSSVERPSHLTEMLEVDSDLVLDVPYHRHLFLRGHVLPAVRRQGDLAVRIDWKPVVKHSVNLYSLS